MLVAKKIRSNSSCRGRVSSANNQVFERPGLVMGCDQAPRTQSWNKYGQSTYNGACERLS
jgi:hypothetical protein